MAQLRVQALDTGTRVTGPFLVVGDFLVIGDVGFLAIGDVGFLAIGDVGFLAIGDVGFLAIGDGAVGARVFLNLLGGGAKIKRLHSMIANTFGYRRVTSKFSVLVKKSNQINVKVLSDFLDAVVGGIESLRHLAHLRKSLDRLCNWLEKLLGVVELLMKLILSSRTKALGRIDNQSRN
jgi:hypothetical protein